MFLVFLPLCLLGTVTPRSESQKSKIIPMKGGGRGKRGVEKKCQDVSSDESKGIQVGIQRNELLAALASAHRRVVI